MIAGCNLNHTGQPAIAYSEAAQVALSEEKLAKALGKIREWEHWLTMESIKLSIIVPCYNSREFIAECLDSILPYLSRKIELIIVNDGSTDDSADIIERSIRDYKEQKIAIINQKNSGISAARNSGIKLATGEYIAFLDSDDMFHPDFWREILHVIDDSAIDIVEFNADQFDGKLSNIVEHIDSSVLIGRVDISSTEQLIPVFRRSKWYPWARVYRSNLFHDYNIEFPIGRLYEDMSTIPALYLHSKVIYGIAKPLIWYRYHKKSITQTFRSKDLVDLVYATQYLASLAQEKKEIKKALFPAIQRTFNLIKYTLVRNNGAKLPVAEQKALRRALLVFISYFRILRKAQILMLPLYFNTIMKFRKK